MTMQIKDSLYYTDKSYTIVTCNTPLCFDPREYGVTPTPYTTACHRGHWSEYSILNDQLVLQNLFIYTNSNDYPPIANIESVPAPQKSYFPSRHRMYHGLQLPIFYTGKILIGSDPTSTHYIKGIRNDPWRFKNLIECVFEGGKLVKTIDHSETAEDIRKFIRTIPLSEPQAGPMGTYVCFNLPLLGYLSNYPWWVELD